MSRRSSNPRRGTGPSPDPDIYVGLLFVAVASLLTGCIFLVMELGRYNWMIAS
jgi:hypothetical protein